ncbi:MAG: transglycosylase SLT domain-containing protein [Alphaproteobacteria bacterium]
MVIKTLTICLGVGLLAMAPAAAEKTFPNSVEPAAGPRAAKIDKAARRRARLARLTPSNGRIVELEVRKTAKGLALNASPEHRAFAAITKSRWPLAVAAFKEIKDPLLRKIVRWYRLQSRTGGASFSQINRFVAANPHWPLQLRLRYRAEYASAWGAGDREVLAFFKGHKPRTVPGALRLAEALRRQGKAAQATALIKRTWANGRFYGAIERKFVAKFGDQLTSKDHIARVHGLLWKRKLRSARRYIRDQGKHFSDGEKALFALRIMLIRRRRPSLARFNAGLAKVPQAMRGHLGLIHDRIRWHRRSNRIGEAIKLMKAVPPGAEPKDKWWSARAWVARVALRTGRSRAAYAVASRHGLKERRLLYEGEWLSGWIALRYLKNPGLARPHFERLLATARYPVSRARGAYWLGRTAEAAGDRAKALKWYRQAARNYSTFYGQFALARLGRKRLILPPALKIAEAERVAFERSELVRAARRLHAIDQGDLARWFVFAAHRAAKTPAQRALASQLGIEVGRPEAAVRTAKNSGRFGQIIIASGYPVIEVPTEIGPEPALILALIRQESEFNYRARSWAGARGLMQLMPRTARRTARNIKARYSYKDLLKDPQYNMKIGTSHLKELIEEFDGSYVLVMGAYNAGAGAVKFWMGVNGDPRGRNGDAVIDWIEAIPVDETRNYIQRVMESMQVYRARLGDTKLAAASVATAWRAGAIQAALDPRRQRRPRPCSSKAANTRQAPAC